MIRLVDKEGVERLCEACEGHPVACRIYSAVMAYGTETRFAEFWLQEWEEEIVGAIAKVSGDVTYALLRNEAEAQEEMETFVKMLYGVRSVFFAAEGEKSVDGSGCSGVTLRWKESGEETACLGAEGLEQAGELYRFLCQSGEEALALPMDDVAYADFSHRMRHGLLRGKGVRGDSGELLACAITTAESPRLAIVGGVFCRKESRGKGYASRVVEALCRELTAEGKEVFVFAYPGAEGFYRRMGFEEIGGWRSLVPE